MTKATDVIGVAIHQVNKISKKFNLAVCCHYCSCYVTASFISMFIQFSFYKGIIELKPVDQKKHQTTQIHHLSGYVGCRCVTMIFDVILRLAYV